MCDEEGGGRGWLLECYDVVARLDRCDAFTNGLNDAGAFVTEDDGEGAFGVFAGEGVCICGGACSAMVLCRTVQK